MNANSTTHDDDDMPAEVDFTGAARGKFYRPNLRLKPPVYLDAEVQDYLNAIAAKKGLPLSQIVSDLLKKEIEITEAVKG